VVGVKVDNFAIAKCVGVSIVFVTVFVVGVAIVIAIIVNEIVYDSVGHLLSLLRPRRSRRAPAQREG